MKKLKDTLFLSCKKANELIEKREMFGLSLLEKLGLFYHTHICDICKNYEKQSAILNQAFKKLHEERIQQTSQLSKKSKQKIINSLVENS